MIVSIAEEMNPTRRNTMEDVHVAHPPGSWGAPDDRATFLGVYDGHGGRLIADYLEDHLAANIANEWAHSESEREKNRLVVDNCQRQKQQRQSKKRRLGDEIGGERDNEKRSCDDRSTQSKPEKKDREGQVIHTAIERAFLLTDIQSRMDGIATSGATVVCCVAMPQFSPDGKTLSSISIHAANVGDARAVLSSRTARPARKKSASSGSSGDGDGGPARCKSKSNLPDPELPGELPCHHRRDITPAVRITCDHKSTDPEEVARIEASGGIMIRGRVLGVLAVARSLGDHGLKEYVIGRPHLSSTEVRILPNEGPVQPREAEIPATSSAPYTDGEFLIVACDGLWDVMEDQEAVEFIRSHVNEHGEGSREGVASFLVEESLKRGSTDNITVIVYWL